MYSVTYEHQFLRDFDHWKKLIPELADELQAVITAIIESGEIPGEYNPHTLTNGYLNYTGNMEFHLLDGRFGILVIYYPNQKNRNFRFIRLGTHDGLFHDREK